MFFKKVIVYFSFFLLPAISLTGCVPVLIGAGVVAGYFVTKDSVSGNLEVSFEELWNVSLSEVGNKADITDQNKQAGLIKARYGKTNIVVRIRELTEHSYNLKVTCRKAIAIADLSLSQDIFTRIVRNLKISNRGSD